MNRFCINVFGLLLTSSKRRTPVSTLMKISHLNFSVYQSNSISNSLQKLKISAIFNTSTLITQRSCSSESRNDDQKKKSKPLMKFDPVLKPEIILTIKNWILAKLIIQPYLDNYFTMKDFTGGSKQALIIVSSLLSQGDFQSLKGLVTDEAIEEIKDNYAALNVKERQDLFIKVTDILFAFPYQIGIFFDDVNQKRFAEITVVYHCMNDFEELKNSGKIITENAEEDIKVCNYRFIREYTKGVQSDWIINRIGHFKLRDFKN